MKTYVQTFESFSSHYKKFNKINEADEIKISEKEAKEIYGNLIFYTHALKNANTFSDFIKSTKTGADMWSKIAGSQNELSRTVKQSFLEVLFKCIDPTIKIEKTYEDSYETVALGALNKRTTSVKSSESYLSVTNKDGITEKISILNPFGTSKDSNKNFPQDIKGFTKIFGEITDEEIVKRCKSNFSKAVSGDVAKLKKDAEKVIIEGEKDIFRTISRSTKGILSELGL